MTPEIYKALSYTGYDGKTMKNENDILMLNNIISDLGYTGIGDIKSKRKVFLTGTLPRLVEKIQNKTLKKLQTTLMIYKEKELKLLYHQT